MSDYVSREGNIDISILTPRKRKAPIPLEVEPITKFDGTYRFLSNFFPFPISFEGITYPTAEHAYQAGKCTWIRDKKMIRNAPSPGVAKRLGREVPLRKDWEDIKLKVMEDILTEKFKPYSNLADMLVKTFPSDLIETNWWGDRFWGMHKGYGENHLGKILMKIRDRLMMYGGGLVG